MFLVALSGYRHNPVGRRLVLFPFRIDGADQTTIYFQDKPPSVTFAWQPNAEAAKYKVQVYRKENLSAAVAEKVGITKKQA